MKNNTFKITSDNFKDRESIPNEFSCDGEGINPSLLIEGVPEKTESLTLIMDDPDVPGGGVFDHWVVFNIDPNATKIEEGIEPEGILGVNSADRIGYYPPCPPDKEHRYFFKLYALDTKLDLKEGATKKEVEEEMKGHIIEKTKIIGVYNRK